MYKIFEKLAAAKGVTPYFVSKETGVAVATLSAWKQGRYHPKDDKLERIADFFDVPLAYLKGHDKTVTCPYCHMEYIPIERKSMEQHNDFHDRFLAVQKYYHLTIPSLADATQKRAESLLVFRDIKYDKFQRLSAFSQYAKYDFIIHLYTCDFDTDDTLEQHTRSLAEMLRPDRSISLDMCNTIREEFGVEPYEEDLSAKVTEKEYRIILAYRDLSEESRSLVDRMLGLGGDQ